MADQPGDASGDVYIAVGMFFVFLAVFIILGIAGFFYHPAWELITTIFCHTVGEGCGK